MFRLPDAPVTRALAILMIVFMIGLPIHSGVTFAQAPLGQPAAPTGIIVPSSSVETTADIGVRAHTNHLIFAPANPPIAGGGLAGENPTSLACVYNLVKTYQNSVSGNCPTNPPSFANPTGGSGVIAIVEAYDYPTAASDLATFSSTFGLPAANFQVAYVTGTPGVDCGWNQEAALDIEWAHAMAPGASIILVEAASNNLSDLLAAVDKATSLVKAAGGGQVSMSWGGSEFRGEANYDSHFNNAGVAYFAAAGDTGGSVMWPGASPNVVSAGGTRVNRDTSGNFTSEAAWSKEPCGSGSCGGGGGKSRYESRPSYQNTIQKSVGSNRGTPDFSFDADPSTGVAVYENSPACTGNNAGWMVFGGTSVSSSALSGIVNTSTGGITKLGTGATAGYPEQTLMYNGYGSAGYYTGSSTFGGNFRDITSGSTGTGFAAGSGWDLATGIGSDQGLTNK